MSAKERLIRSLPLLVAVFGLAVGLLADDFFTFVSAMGYRIPQRDMAVDYSNAVALALLIGVSIVFWPVPLADKKPLLWLWFIRCLITLGFMLIYEEHYGLDAYVYFREAQNDYYPFHEMAIGKGSANIAGLTWLISHALPIPNSYHALKVIYSLVGFIATYLFYRAAVIFLGRSERRFLYLLGLFPSILFWSSILGKDPVNFFGVALYFYGVLAWYKRQKPIYFVPIALGVLVAMSIRVWYGLIFFTPVVAVGIRRIRSPVTKLFFIVVSLAAFAGVFQVFNDRFKFENSKDVVSSTQQLSRSWSRGGSGQEVPEFKSLGQMLAFAPIGMFTALFRPLPGEVMNLFGLLAGLENLGVLILLVMAVRRGGLRMFTEPIVFWASTLVLIWAFFYGFISYQNLGSGARFKLQVLPILLSMLLYLVVVRKQEPNTDVRNNGLPRQLPEA